MTGICARVLLVWLEEILKKKREEKLSKFAIKLFLSVAVILFSFSFSPCFSPSLSLNRSFPFSLSPSLVAFLSPCVSSSERTEETTKRLLYSTMMIETTPETIIRPTNVNHQDEQRFALHLIENPNQLSFDRYAYSRYKYGDTYLAKEFGEELAKGFLNKYEDFLLSSNEEFLAISSPRGLVPPAAYYVFQTFLEKLNRFLQAHNRKLIGEHTIERLGTLAEDYSTLSEHERFERLVGERYFLDQQPIGKKYLLFVDDIRITGKHQSELSRWKCHHAFLSIRFLQVCMKEILFVY